MRSRIRASFRLARLALHLLWGLAIAATVFPRLSGAGQQQLKARWSRQLISTLGLRIVTTGSPPSHGLLVANHISWLDIFAINAVAPTIFLSKDDVLHWPIIGWLARQAGTLFLSRGSRAAAQRAKEQIIDHLRDGKLVGVFPEGTTSLGDDVLPFHAALFQSAIDAEVDVAPVLIRYTDRQGAATQATAYVGETSLWECTQSVLGARGLSVHIDFLPAVPSIHCERRHLSHHCHQLIRRAQASVIPNREVEPGGCTVIETPADPQDEQPSNCRPTSTPSPAPADSSPA